MVVIYYKSPQLIELYKDLSYNLGMLTKFKRLLLMFLFLILLPSLKE
jgi:hypothetical protein